MQNSRLVISKSCLKSMKANTEIFIFNVLKSIKSCNCYLLIMINSSYKPSNNKIG